MIESFWVLNVSGCTFILDEATARDIENWSNSAHESERFSMYEFIDVVTEEKNLIQLAAISYLRKSTPESRLRTLEHNQAIGNEYPQFND